MQNQEKQKALVMIDAKEDLPQEMNMLEQMKQDKTADEMQGISMDEASSPIEDRDCASSISTASLSEPMPHTLTHSYSSSHMSQYSPTYKHLHPVNNLAYTHDEEGGVVVGGGGGMQYASLEDRFPFLKDDRKRTRKLLSPDQTRILEAILERTIYPSTPLREAVARTLGIPPRKVQIWFQNKRQGRRRIPGQSEEEGEDTEMGRMNNGNAKEEQEGEVNNEEGSDEKQRQSNLITTNAPQARERCIEVQSAADDMRLARLRDEYGRQFAELKISPQYCDGDMYPAPHLGQFERYSGAQSQSGDSYDQRLLSSALPSPASAPPHSGNYSEADYASQRRHTMPLHHHHHQQQQQQQTAYPHHRMEAEMHKNRGWQVRYGSGNWHENQMCRSPLWDRNEYRPSHDGFPFDLRHPTSDPRDVAMQRNEHVQMVAQHGPHFWHAQRTPSHAPLSAQARATYHHRYANSHNDICSTVQRSELDIAYEARRRGLSTAPHSAPYPLLRSYSHNHPYDRSHSMTTSEAMHRSFTSFPQSQYPTTNGTWTATRTSSFGGYGIRYQMPPPLSPAERPHTPGSSRSLRSFFHESAGNHRDHPNTSPPHKLQSKDRFGVSPTKEKRTSFAEQKKANEEGKEDDGRINDAYEQVKKINSMPSADQETTKDVPENTCRIASLADVALRHKSRLPPLRIPSSMNNFKDSMDESSTNSSKDEKMLHTKEDRQFVRHQIPRSLSSDDIRSAPPSSMEKSSPMAMDTTPSSPQSAREIRMASPSNSHSPVTPTHRHAGINPFAKSTLVNDRQEVLPSITELMHS